MPRTLATILPASLLLAVGLLAGCSNETADPADSTTAADDYSQMDFSLPYGGLTVTDEDEAFGDSSLQLELLSEEDELVDDPWTEDPVVQQLIDDGNHPYDPLRSDRPVFTFLKLRWGMLHGPDDTLNVEPPCDVTDWSGTIRTDRGYVVVKRVVRFERPADTLIWPRLDPQTVALVSHTSCHFDGLVVQIIERPYDEEDPDYEPNMLHIDLGPYQGEFSVAELAEVDDLVEIDELGNKLQLVGFKLSDINVCPKGFLSGRYRHVVENEIEEAGELDAATEEEPTGTHLGSFAGTWTNLNGRIDGFLRGGYGLDVDGNRVFYGKYIDRRGGFRGFVVGTWGPGGEESDLATFVGEWVNAAGTREGELGGRAYPVEGYPGGFFAGRWATSCDDEALEEIR